MRLCSSRRFLLCIQSQCLMQCIATGHRTCLHTTASLRALTSRPRITSIGLVALAGLGALGCRGVDVLVELTSPAAWLLCALVKAGHDCWASPTSEATALLLPITCSSHLLHNHTIVVTIAIAIAVGSPITATILIIVGATVTPCAV